MKPFITFLLTLLSTFTYAGSQTGKINYFIVRSSDNLHYVYLEGEKLNSPACASNGYWMIKDENSVSGKTQISMIMAAYVAGKPITITGADTCTRWSDGEDINSVRFSK